MPSYYNRIKGTLEVAKLARASDIHLIQSGIQNAISNVIIDMFGPSFVLGESENDLKLVPTAIHVDQINTSCDEDNQWISFYDRYFRQSLFIEKSSIESITLNMINDSKIETTIYAEIRDINYNLLKETNAKLHCTKSDGYEEVTFHFDLHHLGVGRYYFILKPVDISAADLALNGDEGTIEVIEPEMFCVRYDRGGNYEQGLEASYNGVDYLDACLLEDQLEYEDGETYTTTNNNFDLYFEHTFSSGNTYLINPGAAVVHGQKVYARDTHVTIAGPSPLGNRTDLVVLTQEGYLNVIKGSVYNGAIKRPSSDSGLKIAYITSYKTENADWICPNCQVSNDGNSSECYNCGSTINTKVPLIEQADDNGMTRQRDVLERLRRLEKMMIYEQEYNRPTRVKYICTNDPVIFQSNDEYDNTYIDADAPYGMTTIYKGGQRVDVPASSINSEEHMWALREDPYDHQTFAAITETERGKIYIWDLINYDTKPKTVGYGNYITIRVEGSNGHGKEGVPVAVKIWGKSNTFEQTINTNKNGNIRINPYKDCYWGSGKYSMSATHNGATVKATYTVVNKTKKTSDNFFMGLNVVDADKYDEMTKLGVSIDKTGQQLLEAEVWVGQAINQNFNLLNTKKKDVKKLFNNLTIYTIKRHAGNVDIITGSHTPEPIHARVVGEKVITGNDAFHFENATINLQKGSFQIAQVNNKDDEYTTNELISEANPSGKAEAVYTIHNNTKEMNSEYPVLDFHFNGGYIHSLTPYIKKFKNIESFKIILFKNNLTFNQTENHRLVYQKKIEDDENFPNVYVSPEVEISSAAKTDKSGNKILNNYHKFIVDQHIPQGNYSLFFYAKIAEGYNEGAVFVDEYPAMSQSDEYGTATKVQGTCNPAIISLETNSASGNTWDLLREEKSNQYKATGIVISKPISIDGNYRIRSVKLDYNNKIPDGCDMTIQVSNDGGRNWVTAKNNYVTFSGLGSVFEWKVVMRGNGTGTPMLEFDYDRGYALKITLNTITDDYVSYEDYGRCLPSPVMDFTAMTYKVFGDSTITQKDFSEWEWARLFMEDEDRLNNITILISNGNTDSNPIYTSTRMDDWNRNLFFHQAICDLTLDDFEHTSIDYSNYDPTIEHDEYNFRFKYDTEYGETVGSGVAIGDWRNAKAFANYPIIDMGNFESVDKSNISYVYRGNAGNVWTQYSGTKAIAEPYWGTRYLGPQDSANNSTAKYYNSEDDNSYDRRAIIAGMLFEDGLTIDDKYLDLTLDIFVSMGSTEGRPIDENNNAIKYDENGRPIHKTDTNGAALYSDATKIHPLYEEETGVAYFPGGTFEIIVSLNPYGLMDNDASYGRRYTITNRLYNNTYNKISIPDIFDDFVGSDIYCIGIRAIDNSSNAIDSQSVGGLKQDDIIGIGDLKFGSHDRLLYWPSTRRYAWKKGAMVDEGGMTKQHSYASVQEYLNGIGTVIFPLTRDYPRNEDGGHYPNPNFETPDIEEAVTKPSAQYKNSYGGTQFVDSEYSGLGSPIRYRNTDNGIKGGEDTPCGEQSNANDIHITGDKILDGNNHSTDLQFPQMIFTFLQEPVVDEPSFYIDVDFNLDAYKWVRIEHWIESELINEEPSENDKNRYNDGFTYYTQMPDGKWTKTQGQLHAGDIVIEFYDTRNHTDNGVEPVEVFNLPAWGRIQTRSKATNKEVNAWFKVRNGGRIKRIVIKRKNPTGDTNISYPLRLHLYDIGMHREQTVPALGSQLQMRVYPKAEATGDNTNIRKFGVVYRIA